MRRWDHTVLGAPEGRLDRRRFLKLNLMALAGMALVGAAPNRAPAMNLARPLAPGVKLGTRVRDTLTDDDLLFMTQIGLNHCRLDLSEDAATFDNMKRLIETYRVGGVEVFSVMNRLYRSAEIGYALPGRDEKIEQFIAFIRDLGRLGIHTTEIAFYGFPPSARNTTGRTTSRGADVREFNLEALLADTPALIHGRRITAEEMWANYDYFMAAVLPEAEAAGVRIALHPDDPPIPELGGVARIFGHSDSFQRAMETANSPAWGLLFCVGSWAEGGTTVGKSPVEMIRHFGPKGKLFSIHFRNVSSPAPHFHETFMDNGYLDMYQVMKALVEVGYDGLVVPDHLPRLINDEGDKASLAYHAAYMRALLMRAHEELG